MKVYLVFTQFCNKFMYNFVKTYKLMFLLGSNTVKSLFVLPSDFRASLFLYVVIMKNIEKPYGYGWKKEWKTGGLRSVMPPFISDFINKKGAYYYLLYWKA